MSRLSVQLSSHPAGDCGPILASFPAVVPPQATQYACYRDRTDSSRGSPFSLQHTLLSGRHRTVDFLSVNRDVVATSPGSFSDYMVAVHNRRTSEVVIQPAPLYIMSREVKRLKHLRNTEAAVSKRLQARNVLGQTFGSKRAKAAIQAAERNRVDVSAMQGIAHHLQSDIDANTHALPGTEVLRGGSQLGPPCNPGAADPSEVYRLADTVSNAELKAFPVKSITSASSEAERYSSLPYTKSKWVNEHLAFACRGPKPDVSKIRIICYICSMLCFRQAAAKAADPSKITDRMTRVPPVVQESLLSKFAETTRQSGLAHLTSEMEVKLLTYMFVLCLHVDSFVVDIATLAHDLQLPLPRVTKLFQGLGCKVELPTAADRVRLELPKEAVLQKRAILRIPPTFPKQRRATRGRT